MNERRLLNYKDFLNRRPSFLSASEGNALSQLSYGRLWASIDQTPASGNALDIAGYCWILLDWTMRESSQCKVRTFESSRARQLLCAEGVPWGNRAPQVSSMRGQFFCGRPLSLGETV